MHALDDYASTQPGAAAIARARGGRQPRSRTGVVRRQSWAGYTINMFEFEFPTGTGIMAGILLNEHVVAEDGPTVFAHACRLGAEGIVSKKEGGTY
jgi:hypothetical protein